MKFREALGWIVVPIIILVLIILSPFLDEEEATYGKEEVKNG